MKKEMTLLKLNGKNSLYSKEYKSGDTIFNKMYANTLREIMNKGSDGFYKGESCKRYDRDNFSKGGIMTMEDLSEYQSVWRDPVRFKYKNL